MAPSVCEKCLAAPQQHLTESPLCKQTVFSFLAAAGPAFSQTSLFGVGGHKGGENFLITFNVLISLNVYYKSHQFLITNTEYILLLI